MSKKEYLKRYILFIVGLYILSLGIALSTKANLGVSPVSSIPYVLSLASSFSLGKVTILVQLIYIACEILILRKEFNPINFLQIVVVIAYGYFNDFSLFLVSGIQPSNYALQWLLCIASMFVIAFGVNMEVKAGVMMLAVDGLMALISKKWHIDFGKVKITFDCSQVGIAVVCSLICMHKLQGVREGTVAAAIFVGMIIKLYNKKLAAFYEKIGLVPIVAREKAAEEAAVDTTAHVITIAREVGSGGREIGKILGELMGLPVYDKDLLALTAEECGMDPDYVEEKEQNRIYNYFSKLNNEIYAPMMGYVSDDDSIKDAQQEVIRRIASQESCIIVGRLGNYFLKDWKNCFHVFIHGQKEYRVAHFQEEEKLSSYEQAQEKLERKDQQREQHYRYYTNAEYGYYRDYHLSINSAVYGSEETAKLIKDAAEKYFRNIQTKELH